MSLILRAMNHGKDTMQEMSQLLEIPVYTRDDLKVPDEEGYAFRWGCTSCDLGKLKVINKVKAIEEVSDKKGFRKKLADKVLAPRFWGSFYEYLTEVDAGVVPLGELVVRPSHHQRSQNLHKVNSLGQLFTLYKEYGDEMYISEYIEKISEYRVFVVQNRIAWIIEKIPKNKDDVSWGCVQEGSFKYVDWSAWPTELSRVALQSMKLSSLDFGAIDIISDFDPAWPFDQKKRTFALEINTAPFLTPYYIKTIAKTFKHIMKNGRDHFPDPEDYSWKNVIHPAVMKSLGEI